MITDGERIGKFEINLAMLEDIEKRADLFRIFSRMIVLRAEAMVYKNAIEYVAISPLFEPHRQGEILPEYDIVLEGPVYDVNFNRQIRAIRAVRKDEQGRPVSARLMTLGDQASPGPGSH